MKIISIFFIFNLCMLKSSIMCVYECVCNCGKCYFSKCFLLENTSKYYIFFYFLKFNFDTNTSKHDPKVHKILLLIISKPTSKYVDK